MELVFPRYPYCIRIKGEVRSEILEELSRRTSATLNVAATHRSRISSATIHVSSPDARTKCLPTDPIHPICVPRLLAGQYEDRLIWHGGEVRLPHRTGEPCVVPVPGHTSLQMLSLLELAISPALSLQGGAVFHAGGFELMGRAILVLGESGAGKSTLAAAVLRAGGRVLCDDTMLLGIDRGGQILAQPLRRELVLRPPSRHLLPPELATSAEPLSTPAERRWKIDPCRNPDRFLETLRPQVTLLTKVDRRRSDPHAVPLTQAEALAALIGASSLLLLAPRFPAARAPMLRLLMAVAQETRAFRVAMGKGLLTDPIFATDKLLERIR